MASETRLKRIQNILSNSLAPTYLEVIDDSNRHIGHSGASPSGETHYRLKIASPQFKGLSLVEQHRKIYDLLKEELKTGLHALEIESKE